MSTPSPVRVYRAYSEIQQDLKKPIPPKYLSSKTVKGKDIDYIAWYTAVKFLDHFAPEWEGHVKEIVLAQNRIFVTYSITIPCAEGFITREAIGTELLMETDSKTGELREVAYGDPSSNAESMAFRRAAAKHGLGLSLYDR